VDSIRAEEEPTRRLKQDEVSGRVAGGRGGQAAAAQVELPAAGEGQVNGHWSAVQGPDPGLPLLGIADAVLLLVRSVAVRHEPLGLRHKPAVCETARGEDRREHLLETGKAALMVEVGCVTTRKRTSSSASPRRRNAGRIAARGVSLVPVSMSSAAPSPVTRYWKRFLEPTSDSIRQIRWAIQPPLSGACSRPGGSRWSSPPSRWARTYSLPGEPAEREPLGLLSGWVGGW